MSRINAKRLKALLKALTDIYSPSGKEEAILRFLCDYLAKHEFSLIRQPVSDGRYNIIVNPPNREADTVFVGHVDTVFAYDFYEYEFREKRGVVSGLGVADMKGGCAAMIEAFIRFLEVTGAPPCCALALVVGEEENSDGIQKLVEAYSFKRAIVGEPTDLKPCTGHYGYVEFELSLSGARRHASQSGTQSNATYSMLKVIMTILSQLETYGKRVRFNIRDLHSSDAGFAVPGKCSAWLDLHVHPDIALKRMASALRKTARSALDSTGIKKKDFFMGAECHPGYDLSGNWKGFQKVRMAMEENGIAWEPAMFESHSDAAYMKPAGIRPVILGPGCLARAHTRNESVRFSQIVLASQIYCDLLSSL